MQNQEAETTGIQEEMVENQVVNNEEVVENQTKNQEEMVENQAKPQQETTEPVQESSKEKNFRTLRLENERLAQEHAQLAAKLQRYEQQTKEPEEDLEINIGDDELFEGKHYKKIQKQLQKQQEQMRQYQNQVQLTATETKLKVKFPDFDKVINTSNIERLRQEEPEIAEAIASTQDVYSKAVSAYKMIKKLGIYVEDNYQSDRDIALKNSLKPKPLASVSPQQGVNPLTKANAFANGLTPELKAQLWKEMEESSKGY